MRYGILFDCEIWHDYQLNFGEIVHESLSDAQRAGALERYQVSGFLAVSPTEETQDLLAGHGMIFKSLPQGFRVGVRLDPSSSEARPLVPPADPFALVFRLSVRDPKFFNFTALPDDLHGYRFGNNAPDRSELSAPVPAFSALRAYRADDVYGAPASSGTDLFRALRDTGPSAAPVAADWERIPRDTFDPAASYTAGALVLSQNRVLRALVDAPGIDLDDPARWRLESVLENQYVTEADRAPSAPPADDSFGSVAIGLGAGTSSLLDGTGALRSPRYKLRFLNRATRWRYIFPQAQPVGVGAEVSPDLTNARVLITPTARALTRFGAGVRLQADGAEQVLLPQAEANLVRRENAELYSDVHTLNLQL